MSGFLEKIFGIVQDPDKVGRCRIWIDYEPPEGDVLKINVPALRYKVPLTNRVQTAAEFRKATDIWLEENGLELRNERYVQHSLRWGPNITGILYRAAPKAEGE